MSLKVGDKLGPYEILAPIGAGGMGEVYRARDTKLDRDVAIKVLPAALAQDPERLARFEREAKVLAALNHPNIAQIYGLEQRALVMELVEGETLKGPLPVQTALNYAKQIADALEAAHEKGITHRDLKPPNIMITLAGVVKVLDFGLAAVAQDPGSSTDPANSPTLTMRATQAGMIMGTAAYMSPEQAAGKPVDKRTDIWSFGVVLWEMLTGQQLFTGETVSHVLAAVLTKEPDPSALPAALRPVVEKCLRKDPRKRWRDIGDVRLALEEGGTEAPQQADGRPATKLTWAIGAAVMALVAAVAVFGWWRATRPVDHPLMRMSVDLGPEAVAGARTTVAISPDGTRIAFPIRGAGGTQQLATRLMDQATPTALPGTENAEDAFFSPDGQWIGFFADGKLKKISVLGGAAVMLCGAPNARGGTWGEDGNIIASLGTNVGLSRVPAAGGVPQPLTKVSREETSHRWPQALPGSSAILFTAGTRLAQFVEGDIDVVSLKTGEVKTVARGGSYGRFLPTRGSMGHLVYVHEGVLFSAPFDPVKLETLGTPVPVLEDMASDPTSGGGQFEFSGSGTFVYRSGRAAAQSYPVMWLDGSGKIQPLLPMPGNYNSPRFSPDGRRLALVAGSSKGRDAYVYDMQRDTLTRLTFTGQGNNPVWSPDGKHILFWSTGSLWWIRADGAGEAQKLLEGKNGMFPSSFSPDGRRLAYTEVAPDTGTDIWTLPLDLTDAEHPKPGKPEPFLRTPLDEGAPVFSPDGRWVSYVSGESGRLEVYVRPFQGPGGKWQISTGGGMYSFWSRDGHQLFYETPDHARIMVVDYTASGDALAPGKPRVWSEAQARSFPAGNPPLDLAPDGKRFAILPRNDPSEAQTGSIHVTFLLNFFDELRRRVPAGGKN